MNLKPQHQQYRPLYGTYLRALMAGHMTFAKKLHDAAHLYGHMRAFHAERLDVVHSIEAAVIAWRHGHLSAEHALSCIGHIIDGTDIRATDL